jgi:hypothetical protein
VWRAVFTAAAQKHSSSTKTERDDQGMKLQMVNVKSAHERIEFDVSVDKDGAVTIKHGALGNVRRADQIVVLPVLEE